MAIQSLWSGAWMIHVTGFSRTQAANHLAAMNVAMVVAYALIDTLQASGHSVVIAHRNAFAALFVLQLAAYLWMLVGGRTGAAKDH